jgi:hypothetical protein
LNPGKNREFLSITTLDKHPNPATLNCPKSS